MSTSFKAKSTHLPEEPFFYETFDLISTHIPTVAGTREENVNSIALRIDPEIYMDMCLDALEYMLDTMTQENPQNVRQIGSIPLRINNIVSLKPSNHICIAGDSTVSVWTNGEIYSCFMFYGQDKFRIGHIDDKLETSLERNSGLSTIEGLNNKSHIEQCRNCFARNACAGCAGDNYFSAKDGEIIPESFCNLVKKSLEKFLFKYVEIKEDPAKWQHFKTHFSETYLC